VLQFGFVNFQKAEDCKNCFINVKKDQEIRRLLDDQTGSNEFIYYAQSESLRQQYLKMAQKNIKAQQALEE
jgi:hypothetical protein